MKRETRLVGVVKFKHVAEDIYIFLPEKVGFRPDNFPQRGHPQQCIQDHSKQSSMSTDTVPTAVDKLHQPANC